MEQHYYREKKKKTTPYVVAGDINSVIKSLQKSSKALFDWFKNNFWKSNANKYNLVSSCENVCIRVKQCKKKWMWETVRCQICSKAIRISVIKLVGKFRF